MRIKRRPYSYIPPYAHHYTHTIIRIGAREVWAWAVQLPVLQTDPWAAGGERSVESGLGAGERARGGRSGQAAGSAGPHTGEMMCRYCAGPHTGTVVNQCIQVQCMSMSGGVRGKGGEGR
jgi:hypothetical protein